VLKALKAVKDSKGHKVTQELDQQVHQDQQELKERKVLLDHNVTRIYSVIIVTVSQVAHVQRVVNMVV
jgi:hypothetical protein